MSGGILYPNRRFVLGIDFHIPEDSRTDEEIVAFITDNVTVTLAGQQFGKSFQVQRVAAPLTKPQ